MFKSLRTRSLTLNLEALEKFRSSVFGAHTTLRTFHHLRLVGKFLPTYVCKHKENEELGLEIKNQINVLNLQITRFNVKD